MEYVILLYMTKWMDLGDLKSMMSYTGYRSSLPGRHKSFFSRGSHLRFFSTAESVLVKLVVKTYKF